MKYLEKLELDSKIKFGTEIEFKGIELTSFFHAFSNLPIVMIKNHKGTGFRFDDWCLDFDSSVSLIGTNPVKGKLITTITGGEISSKILSNEKSDWIELRQICDSLKKFGAYTDEYCGNHISVGTELIKDNLEFYKTLSKIVAVFEKELITFSCGESKKIRINSFEYAKSMQYELLQRIKTFKIYNEQNYQSFMYKLCHTGYGIFCSLDGINFQEINTQNRIEFRYPNGTINPIIIQNNINFFLKLVLAIINGKIDIKYLNQKIEETNPQEIIFNNFDLEKAEILSNWISLNENDKSNFMCQFKKGKRTV